MCNLVALLALGLPRFASALVIPDDDSQHHSFILQMTRAITRLLPSNEEGDRAQLAKEALRTLDLLIWIAPRECDIQYAYLSVHVQ